MRRQLWLMFLDATGDPIPLVVPIEDVPMSADPQDVDRTVSAITGIAEASHAAAVILTWERPGPARLGRDEDRHVEAIGVGVSAAGLRVRAQLLAHDRGVRLLG